MLMYTVRLLLIIAIYCDGGVNSINQTEFSGVNALGDTSEDFMQEMMSHTVSILCKLQPNLVHVYYDKALRTNVAEKMILSLGNCTSLMLARYEQRDTNVQQANDDGVKMFLLNIISRTDDDLNLSFVRNNSGDKHTSHFIILVEDSLNVTESWLEKVFRKFWDYSLLKVLVIFAQQNDVNIFTYTPFGNDFIVKLPTSAVTYDELFWDKTHDLNGHPFRISLFPENTRAIFNENGKFSGTDGYLTDVMIEQMNAKLDLRPPTDGYDIGEFLKNGSSTGSLNQIITRAVDVSFNTRFLRLAQFQGKVQITFTNGRDDVCILVAKAGIASNFNNIFRAFSSTVWMFTFISLLSASIGFFAVYRLGTEQPTMKNIFFNFYSWHLAQPINKLPERWSSKVLIAFWIMYCLLINSSYEGNLTSNLVLRPTLPEINTIRQLEQSSFEIITFGRYVDLLQNFLNQTGTYNKLKKRIRGVSATVLAKHIEQNDARYAYANKYHINQYIVQSKAHSINGRPVFNHMTECPVPYLVAYAVGYGSPYLYRINTILRRTQENGFIPYWDQKNAQTSAKTAGAAEGGPVSLTVDHVLSSFYILGLGLVIATVGFVIELVEAKVKSTNCKMNRKGNPIQRPYEIIETEETVTRYFEPSRSKVLTNPISNSYPTHSVNVTDTQYNEETSKRRRKNLHERRDLKTAKNDTQLQALFEKFNKLRTLMSELTDKFIEINSATHSKSPAFDDVRDCEKKKLPENLNSVSQFGQVDLQTDNHQAPPSANQVIGDDDLKQRETDRPSNHDVSPVDVPLLNKSKELLINLIDNELLRLQSRPRTSFPDKADPMQYGNLRQMKMECIDRIAGELAVLKGLEAIEDANRV